MVSTQLPIVTEAALEVLRDGGNAVDAAITAVFVQHVNDFHQTSHFGAMSGIFYEAKTGRFLRVQRLLRAAALRSRRHGDAIEGGDWRQGPRPRGAARAVRHPAVGELPRSGHRVGRRGRRRDLVHVREQLRRTGAGSEWIQGNPGARVLHARRPPRAGRRRWKMPALAATLRRLAAEGADYMYTGEWAQKFVKEAGKRGGRVTLDD
jgi:gamma-glutamyltranspeptidase / glutathione hydrolase